MDKNKIREILKKTIKIKINRDSIFFIAVTSFRINTEEGEIPIKEQGILLPSGLPSLIDENYITLSIIYKTDINDIDTNPERIYEGLLYIEYNELIAALLCKKIVAVNTRNNKVDSEIEKIIEMI